MPMYEIPLPVSTTNPKITHNGVDYNLVESVFTPPAVASTNLSVVSDNAGDNTQNIVIKGIVAGAETSESIALTDTTPAPLALDFTEVFEAYLDAVCTGIITISDSLGNPLGTIAAGRQVLSPDVFKRVGKDGNEVILPLCGGDEFVGEVLEGQWMKDWDADIVTFTARINGVVTGMLELGGESALLGTLRHGWLNNHHPFVMMNEAELEVEMEIPTSDTGAAAGEDIYFEFYIRNQKELIRPYSDDNYILIRFFVDENGLLMQLIERVGGAAENLIWDGSTADGNDGIDPAADKFWIFRFVFHDAVAGAAAPENVRHMHVYAKHAATRVGLDTATEEELFDTVGGQASPYDISAFLFMVGYPAYQIKSANGTWFGAGVGSGNEAISTYLRTSYPQLFALKYDFVDASYGYGDVELWDTKGSATEADWQQVFDEDHDFGTNDIVLQNGLIRLYIDRAVAHGLKLYYWTGVAWVQPFEQIYFQEGATGGRSLSYPVLLRTVSVSPEKITVRVRLRESPTEDEDVYIDANIILERGKYYFIANSLDVFPSQTLRAIFANDGRDRFGYAGDAEASGIGDVDVSTDGSNNVLTDNFMIGFDNAGPNVIGFVSSNRKSSSFLAFHGFTLSRQNFTADEVSLVEIGFGLIPFHVAHLYSELTSVVVAARNNLDGDGVDTITEGHVGTGEVTAFDANSVVADNAVENSVGAQCVSITSVGAGASSRGIFTPNVALNPEKFDKLYVYLHADAPRTVAIYLRDADGDYLWRAVGITAVATEYELDIPHEGDLVGWTEVSPVDGFDWDTFTDIVIGHTPVGGGEIDYVDGLRFFIDTTTTRGRGENLSGTAWVLDANGERVRDLLTSLNLTPGRYIVTSRAKDVDNVANDFGIQPYNETYLGYINEEHKQVRHTLGSTFAYISEIIDIKTTDIEDVLRSTSQKMTAGENTIFVDYTLLIPIGNGKGWAQDLAHAVMRTFDKPRRLYVR